ncbi:MAG: RAMP superfamily CRISPR-associated protein [Lachnospiraceae bacterium]
MKTFMIKMECLTNLHVGNGDVNYNIVDNEVEKDYATGAPVINSSGIKGAFRSYFSTANNANVTEWFGSSPKEKESHKQGKLKFIGATLLARPYRTTMGDKPFYLVTTDDDLNEYRKMCDAFGIDPKCDEKGKLEIAVEGIELKDEKRYLLEDEFETVVISDGNRKKAIREAMLPVISRNHLESGISSNLWYEEVVPHESVFYSFVAAEDTDESLLRDFANSINGKVIQFGGNASIGYGLCKVSVREGK